MPDHERSGYVSLSGTAQIELWTGKEAPVEAMRRELLDIIADIRLI